MTADIIERINIMGKNEIEPDGLEFADLFGDIVIHDNKVDVNKEIVAEETLSAAGTLYNAWEDLDSDAEDSEVDSNS